MLEAFNWFKLSASVDVVAIRNELGSPSKNVNVTFVYDQKLIGKLYINYELKPE